MGSIVSSIWGGIENSRATGAAANIVTGTDREVAQRIQDAVTQGEQQAQAGVGYAKGDLQGGLSRYDQQMDWALNKANPLLADFYNQGVNALNPYLSKGNAAFGQLADLTAPGSAFMKPFDASMMAAQDPDYQFRLQQGLKQMQAAASASGGLGGAALRSADQYSQGLASSEYANAFNRYMQNRAQTFGMLNTVANYGSQATNELLNLQQNTAGRMAGNIMATGAGEAGAALNVGEREAGMDYGTGQFLANFGLGGQQDVGNWLDKSAQSAAAGILGQNAARGQIIGGIGQGINALLMGAAGAAGLGGMAGGLEGFGQGAMTGLGFPGFGPSGGGASPNFGGYGGYSRELGPNDPFWTSGASGGAPPDISGYYNPPSVPNSFWQQVPTIPWTPVGT